MVTVLSIDGGGIRGVVPARVPSRASPPSRRWRREPKLRGALRSYRGNLDRRPPGTRYRPSGQEGRAGLFNRRPPRPLRTARQGDLPLFGPKRDSHGGSGLSQQVFGRWLRAGARRNLRGRDPESRSHEPLDYRLRYRAHEASLVEASPSAAGVERGVGDYFMRDAARASAAAPTYFPPAVISPVGEPDRRFSLIDGAVFANNPAGLAYVEAAKIFPREREFLIVSLRDRRGPNRLSLPGDPQLGIHGVGQSCEGFSDRRHHVGGTERGRELSAASNRGRALHPLKRAP